MSIHSCRDVSNAEKLDYLRHSLKDGSAKAVIEGLLQKVLGSNCITQGEIRSTKANSSNPRHVQKICEAPSLKDGSGKELKRLHDTVQLTPARPQGDGSRSLWSLHHIELKLDQTTML